MIAKTGGGFVVKSEKTGKKLSKNFKSRMEALKRLRQIEFFKHKGK